MPPEVPGVSKEPEGPKDHNYDPFLLNLKKIQNSKNQQKTLFFDDFEGFLYFLQFWLKTSAKTDHGCDP